MNEDVHNNSEIQEDNSSSQSTYSCCIAFPCVLCGIALLLTSRMIESEPQPNHYNCRLTLPFSYFCGFAFMMAAAIRIIFIILFCLQQKKHIHHTNLYHRKVKHAEFMIAISFFFFGTLILMVKEECIELTFVLLCVLVLTAIMIIQICLYDIEEDYQVCQEVLDY